MLQVKNIRTSFFIILISLLFGCSSVDADEPQEEPKQEEKQLDKGYESGTYCANVRYYNPNTGTIRNYTLNVEVEDNEVVKIHFGNGGWLDSDHMSPQELDSDGTCQIINDKGYHYDVEITGSKCSFTDEVVQEKLPITLADCAYSIGMTEEELSTFEKELKTSRTQVVSEEMCKNLEDYLPSLRRKNALDKAMEDGYIQKTHHQSMGEFMKCSMVIVKRRGKFYLLEVDGGKKCTMGLMQFDPSLSIWQEVIVQESPSKPDLNVYQMRLVSESESMNDVESLINVYCNN